MIEPDNYDRVVRVSSALDDYAASVEMDRREDMQALVTDFMTDLRHYCAFYSISFDDRLAASLEHFEQEKG